MLCFSHIEPGRSYQQDSAPILWRYLDFPQDSIIVFPENNELQAVSQPGHHPYVLLVSESLLASVADELELPEPGRLINKGVVARCDPNAVNEIRLILEWLCPTVKLSTDVALEALFNPELQRKALRHLLLALASSKDIKPRPKRIDRGRVAKRVLDYVNADSTTMPTIQELCRIAAVDERTLRNVFYDLYSISPKTYIIRCRLNTVRIALLTSSPSHTKISDIALSHGFWHMGQFAKIYRQLFGELPSETLRMNCRIDI